MMKNPKKMTSAHLFVSGLVQGVGFRKFTHDCATALHLKGSVQNLLDGRVALQVKGEREKIETLILNLQEGPRHARVDKVDVRWDVAPRHDDTFSITYN